MSEQLPKEMKKSLKDFVNTICVLHDSYAGDAFRGVIYNITEEFLLKNLTIPTDEGGKKQCKHRYFLSHSGYIDEYTCHFCGHRCEKKDFPKAPVEPQKSQIEQLKALGPIMNEYQQHSEFLELRNKVEQIITTVNHQQEQIQQLLSGK